MDITDLDAHALSAAIHDRSISCRETMQATLARIEAMNPTFNAIVSLQDGDALLRAADVRDAELARGASRGWMHGMPQAIKDLAETANAKVLEAVGKDAAEDAKKKLTEAGGTVELT